MVPVPTPLWCIENVRLAAYTGIQGLNIVSTILSKLVTLYFQF